MNRDELARRAGVPASQVEQVTPQQVRQAVADQVPATVLETLFNEPSALYWRAGGSYWLDDSLFGDPVRVEDLRYASDIGLYDRTAFEEMEQ